VSVSDGLGDEVLFEAEIRRQTNLSAELTLIAG